MGTPLSVELLWNGGAGARGDDLLVATSRNERTQEGAGHCTLYLVATHLFMFVYRYDAREFRDLQQQHFSMRARTKGLSCGGGCF